MRTSLTQWETKVSLTRRVDPSIKMDQEVSITDLSEHAPEFLSFFFFHDFIPDVRSLLLKFEWVTIENERYKMSDVARARVLGVDQKKKEIGKSSFSTFLNVLTERILDYESEFFYERVVNEAQLQSILTSAQCYEGSQIISVSI